MGGFRCSLGGGAGVSHEFRSILVCVDLCPIHVWEGRGARTQPTNWEQARPTRGSGKSPSRTQCGTRGDHAEQARQQPPNAADAERAIGNQAPPSTHGVPTACGTVNAVRRLEILVRGTDRWGRSRSAQVPPRSANGKGEEQHSQTGRGSHTRKDRGECSGQGREGQQGRGGSKDSGNRASEWRSREHAHGRL